MIWDRFSNTSGNSIGFDEKIVFSILKYVLNLGAWMQLQGYNTPFTPYAHMLYLRHINKERIWWIGKLTLVMLSSKMDCSKFEIWSSLYKLLGWIPLHILTYDKQSRPLIEFRLFAKVCKLVSSTTRVNPEYSLKNPRQLMCPDRRVFIVNSKKCTHTGNFKRVAIKYYTNMIFKIYKQTLCSKYDIDDGQNNTQ